MAYYWLPYLARRRRPVASVIALDTLRWSMRLGTYHCIDRASKTADKYGTFLSFFFWQTALFSVLLGWFLLKKSKKMTQDLVEVGE